MLNHLGSEYIYRNEDKKSAIFDMSILDNKYLGVKTNKVTIEKLKELKTISSNLNNIQVLPSLSDANFLLKKITCLPIVWDVSTGLNNRKKLEKKINLFSSMLNKCEYVILQKNVPTKYTIFTRMVIESWSISKDYNYWTVYKNNKQQKKHY